MEIEIPEKVMLDVHNKTTRKFSRINSERNKNLIDDILNEKGFASSAYWEDGQLCINDGYVSRKPSIVEIGKRYNISSSRAKEVFMRFIRRITGDMKKDRLDNADRVYRSTRYFDREDREKYRVCFANNLENLAKELVLALGWPQGMREKEVFKIMEKIGEHNFDSLGKHLNNPIGFEMLLKFYNEEKYR